MVGHPILVDEEPLPGFVGWLKPPTRLLPSPLTINPAQMGPQREQIQYIAQGCEL